MPTNRYKNILTIHERLKQHFGDLQWWPAESPFEVIIGAILTQNTAWSNVEIAISNLRYANAINIKAINELPCSELETLIKPTGYFRQKTTRLKLLSRHLEIKYQGQLEVWWAGPLEEARQRLLQQIGIGPETADTILLYAANRPSFVIDTYTRRIFSRLRMFSGNESYTELRDFFMRHLPRRAELFNAFHAEIVTLGKHYCLKTSPKCIKCPLLDICPYRLKTTGV